MVKFVVSPPVLQVEDKVTTMRLIGVKFLLRAGLMVLAVLASGAVQARVKTYIIGEEAHPWQDSGELKNADYESQPGWILPGRISLRQNLLNQLYKEKRLFAGYGRDGEVSEEGYQPGDGRLWSPNLRFEDRKKILLLADGEQDTLALEEFSASKYNLGVTVYADLGQAYPVRLVRFYPLNRQLDPALISRYPDFDWGAHESLYMKGYELWANDGSPETQDKDGRPIYSLLSAVPVNQNVVVADSSFPLQHIRYLKLRCAVSEPFEIDQLEIRGEGYFREARFTSEIIDLGEIANLGGIWWVAEKEPGTEVLVQTRVGKDKTTLRYFRVNEIGEEEELIGETDEENYQAWKNLKESERGRGGVPDTENWSPWSPPYKNSGDPIVVVGPRRYLQVAVTMVNRDPSTQAKVDNISFEYSQPVVARRLWGKISPTENVDLGATVRFRYTLRPTIGSGDLGFDVFQINTPVQARVESLKVGGRPLFDKDYSVQAEGRKLTIQLLGGRKISSDADSVELVFDCSILTYGTVFAGKVWASWTENLPQDVEEEKPGDLAVRGSERSLGRVIGALTVSPNPFTPNGDGQNDVASIYFKVFQVIGTAPITVDICDLSGVRLRTISSQQESSGEFRNRWDGLDAEGKLVSPGIYVVRIRVEGDQQRFEETKTVVVVY
ncbi:MAG TPA: hypothetical protein EYP53_10210 [Candidatus Latescibacteria bacterium]|nr:hypothetical protein [Candidatus Latescibacterota bacterium]